MFENFTTADIDTAGARIHLRHGGKGPPLLLLHGNPMTHVTWHKIAGRLAERFHVVAADLRGYGDSVGPEEGGENHINYSFRVMAEDQIEIMARLGYKSFFAAGHDRGARTVHRMCLDHPEAVTRAAVVDLGFFAPEAFAEYVRCFTWKTIRGSCEDYRACATCDLEMDTADWNSGRKVICPLLAIWGARSHTGTVHGDILAVWRDYGTNVSGGPIDCGHYVPEEAPDATLRWFLDHFTG